MNALSALPRFGQLLAAVVVFSGSQAFAQSTVVQTNTFTNLTDSNPQQVVFNSFNTSLGTLTGVTLELSNVVISGYATIVNNNATTKNYTLFLHGDYAVSDSAGNTVPTVSVNSSTIGPVAVGPGAPNMYTSPTINNASSPGDSGPISVANLSAYSNGTPITVTINPTDYVSVTGPNFTAAEFSSASGLYTLTYTYTPVPEPTKTAACMIGFALCVLVGRNYFKGRHSGPIVA